jgi:adenylate cyclase
MVVLALAGVCMERHTALSTAIRKMQGQLQEADRRIEQISSHMEGFRSLFKVTALLNTQFRLGPLLEMITKEAVLVLRAHRSSLMLLDRKRGELRCVATYGQQHECIREARVPLGEGIAGWVTKHGRPRLIQGQLGNIDTEGDGPRRRISSSVCVPLKMGEKTLGVLNVCLEETDRQFDDNELRLMMIYANHAAVAIRNAALFRLSREKVRLRSLLERYVSREAARTLMKDPRGWLNIGDMRELTVLFADIRGFTGVVQEMGPRRTRLFLNDFFSRMTEIIFLHHGTLDKFIGDSVMAFFGAPLEVEEPARKAVLAAKEMVRAFGEIVQGWLNEAPVLGSLSLGVGVSTGELFIGNVGSTRRLDYTLIGSEVSVAKRLCDMADGGQVLVSDKAKEALKGTIPLKHLGDVRVKGIERPIHVFEVLPLDGKGTGIEPKAQTEG